MRKRWLAFWSLLWICPAVAADPSAGSAPGSAPTDGQVEHEPPDWVERAEFSGTAFLDYLYNASDGAENGNAFRIRRAYLGVRASPAEHVRLGLTLDAPNRADVVSVDDQGVTTEVEQSGRHIVVLKYAYLEVRDLGATGLWIRLGMHEMPWVPFEEKVWGYRFQGPVFPDREGYLTDSDLGLGVGYACPADSWTPRYRW